MISIKQRLTEPLCSYLINCPLYLGLKSNYLRTRSADNFCVSLFMSFAVLDISWQSDQLVQADRLSPKGLLER